MEYKIIIQEKLQPPISPQKRGNETVLKWVYMFFEKLKLKIGKLQHSTKKILFHFVEEIVPSTVLGIGGGLAICLGAYFSNTTEYPILAPLLFSVGVFLTMAFNLGLITRFVPTHTYTSRNIVKLLIITLSNLLIAHNVGKLVSFSVEVPQNALYGFWWALLGGVVIGLVELNNKIKTPYQPIIALILIYGFVELKMPHAVVWAFCHAPIQDLLIVLIGNLVGGVALNFGFRAICNSRS